MAMAAMAPIKPARGAARETDELARARERIFKQVTH